MSASSVHSNQFLATKRLELRFTSGQDLEAIYQLRSSEEVMKRAANGIQTRDEVEKFMKTARLVWLVLR